MQKYIEKEVTGLKNQMALNGGGDSDGKGMAAAAKAITDECARYFTRMNQSDQRINQALVDVKGLHENFENKQARLRKDMLSISNIRN
jgi:hypothetical protein